jgi:hypothetical protein
MSRPRSTADAPHNDARRLFEAGWTVEALADLTGTSPRTVHAWLEVGNPTRPNVSAGKILARAWADHTTRPPPAQVIAAAD